MFQQYMKGREMGIRFRERDLLFMHTIRQSLLLAD